MSTAISVTVLILFWLACAVCAIELTETSPARSQR